jgi:hypothetical protein
VDLERAVTMIPGQNHFSDARKLPLQNRNLGDGQHWTLAVDQTQNTSTDKIRTDVFATATSAHLVRVTFVGKPAAVAELEVSGHLTAQ